MLYRYFSPALVSLIAARVSETPHFAVRSQSWNCRCKQTRIICMSIFLRNEIRKKSPLCENERQTKKYDREMQNGLKKNSFTVSLFQSLFFDGST